MNFLKITKTKEILLVSCLLIFSFLIRIYYLSTMDIPPLIYDAHNYDVMTRQLLDKGVFGYASNSSNAYITPGYPLFLAAIYKIFGYAAQSPLMEVRVIQIFLTTITIGIVYLLGKKILNRRVGFLAAFFFSIYLVAIWVPTTILTEALFTFFFVLYLYFQMIALGKNTYKWDFVAGTTLAAAVLVRPSIAPLMFLPYIYYYFNTKNNNLIKKFLIMALGFTILMMPWWIRNFVTLNEIVLSATQEDPLLRGTYPYGIGEESIPYTNQKKEAIKRLVEGFTKQPLLYIKWFTIGKFDWLYFKIYYYVGNATNALSSLLPFHNFIVWFGWVGVLLSFIRKEIRLISLYVILFTFIHLIFVATSRYSYPIMPLLMLLSAYIIDILFRRKTTEPI